MGMAAVIYRKGGPDNFAWEEIRVGAPERGQVRLRSTAVGVNFADTYHRAGIPHPMIIGDPPVVLGFEGVGEIEELGPGVTGFAVGERVCTCLPPLGAYSQERLYPADKLIKVPKDLPLDDVQLAGLVLKGMTAQYLLHRTHKVQPGDYVLIHAAAGGVGSVAGQLARAQGARLVLGTVGSKQKIASAESSGNDRVFLREGFVEATRSVTAGRGVDVILDAAGEPTRSQSLSLLAPFGRMVHFGNASGNPDIPTTPGMLLTGNKGILGYSLSNLRKDDPRHLVATARQAMDLLLTGQINVAVVDKLPLEQAALAHRLMESNANANAGKLLLQVRL